jgi:hypothetical protein
MAAKTASVTDLAALKALSEAATRGPWKYPYRRFPGVVGTPHGCLWTSTSHAGQINHEPDAEFIVAAVNYVRALLDAER